MAQSQPSGFDQIQQLAVVIQELVTLAGAAGPGLGVAEGIGLVVLLLEALPSAEPDLPLDHDVGHGALRATAFSIGSVAQRNQGHLRTTTPKESKPPAQLSRSSVLAQRRPI